MLACTDVTFENKEYRLRRATQMYAAALDELFFSNPDEGVQIVSKPRQSCEYVETTEASKKLVLIAWNAGLSVESSKSTKVEPLQSGMGKFEGETIKVKPNASLPAKSIATAHAPRATCVSCDVCLISTYVEN